VIQLDFLSKKYWVLLSLIHSDMTFLIYPGLVNQVPKHTIYF